jgi:HK97 family phage major capsid protein
MLTLEEIRALLASAKKAVKAYEDAHKERMTKDELAAYKALIDEVDNLKEQETLRERSDRQAAQAAAKDVEDGTVVNKDGVRVPAQVKDGKGPFKTFGEQLLSIAAVTMSGDSTGRSDPRLKFGQIKSAGANETIASEGGFLVQEDFSTSLLNLVHETGGLINLVTNIPISSASNALKLPTIDETSRQRGSRWGGVRAYWLAEGEQKIDSKPKFAEISLGLNKLAALGYATDELLADSTALQAIMTQGFTEEIRFEVEDSIVNGNGVGKPLGFLNSGAVITVSKDSGQAAGTITFNNLVRMLDRLPVRSRRNAVWLVADSQVETALYSLTLPGAFGYPIYLPPGQNNQTPGNQTLGTLLGRPVMPVEYLPALGTVGDICLVDLSEYIMIDKGGVQAAESMHVRFIYDEMTFRMVYRVDGKPAWRQPVTTANGAITKSPFIVLQSR